MIQLPPFRRIFPINRTRVFPSWGNSYVDNWPIIEDFILIKITPTLYIPAYRTRPRLFSKEEVELMVMVNKDNRMDDVVKQTPSVIFNPYLPFKRQEN